MLAAPSAAQRVEFPTPVQPVQSTSPYTVQPSPYAVPPTPAPEHIRRRTGPNANLRRAPLLPTRRRRRTPYLRHWSVHISRRSHHRRLHPRRRRRIRQPPSVRRRHSILIRAAVPLRLRLPVAAPYGYTPPPAAPYLQQPAPPYQPAPYDIQPSGEGYWAKTQRLLQEISFEYTFLFGKRGPTRSISVSTKRRSRPRSRSQCSATSRRRCS